MTNIFKELIVMRSIVGDNTNKGEIIEGEVHVLGMFNCAEPHDKIYKLKQATQWVPFRYFFWRISYDEPE